MKASTKTATEPRIPAQLEVIIKIVLTIERGMNSPQIGLQRLVPFSSNKNPSEQTSMSGEVALVFDEVSFNEKVVLLEGATVAKK